MENRSHSGGRSESYFPSWLLESTWDMAGPSQPPCRTPVMSPTRGAVKEAALASLRSWAEPRSEISPRGLRLGACGLLLLSPPWGRGMGAAGWAAWAGPRVTGRVSEALRPRRRGGADIGLWFHSMSALSWADMEAKKPSLKTACLGLPLTHDSLVLCPQTGYFTSLGIGFLLCETR